MNNISDEHIIQQILKGNQELFKIIIQRYEQLVYSLGMRFFKNHDDASDFTQEVFVKVYGNLYSFKGTASFKTWMMKVCYNHAVNKIAQMQNNNTTEYHDTIADTSEPLNIFMKNELGELLEQAINALPPAYKVCIDLYFYAGLPFKEISGITGYPVNTIKSYVFRAKQHLRDALKGTIADDYHEM
ncbi:MAG TPA: sigma-70 family RNA polymerase sigma factor [Spirochaetota bacterium]|nr:sigma-70 family RNA polymerase sigma factor [Spirochaetota bacterium]